MNERGTRRAVVVAAILALALLLAWWWSRGDREDASARDAASRSGSRAALDAGALALFDGGAPPKPRSIAASSSERAPSDYAWANEQPPPDYMGEPDDAGGIPLPAKAPRADVVVLDEQALAARQRDTIAFLEREMEALDRRAAHADESGQSELAAALRGRRSRLEARREALRALVDR